MVEFTVYLDDPSVPQGLSYGSDSSFSISDSGVLRVESTGHVRHYAPGYWQQVHEVKSQGWSSQQQ
ncbi:hypothetical protein D7D52_36050 [Nocardia yunnanensis]|uniref:Uncharacterized protein n=1 Tax=Nocardia yunnanensis TaxID=2382165 RepID=A0A386ZM20_9NOCA|nr:hypothetical protein [Nocardia yunnanensis]AYF78353.1 hypothetical protein D7D52_36050 [Nocardia yunnanensis]